jgi:hypothetical protein
MCRPNLPIMKTSSANVLHCKRSFGDVDGGGDNSAPTLTTATLDSTIDHVGTALITTDAATAQYFDLPAPSMMLQWPDLGL